MKVYEYSARRDLVNSFILKIFTFGIDFDFNERGGGGGGGMSPEKVILRRSQTSCRYEVRNISPG